MNINYTPLLYAMNECFEVEITFILSEKTHYICIHILNVNGYFLIQTNVCSMLQQPTANKKKKKPLYLCKLPI